ncbi:huntingtin-interacting protein K [Benincasa hispida]|uniref:huntingtin-interacting protein K n=1 Tax=Benincasa hispida TaxID=102211 RepID=UPI0019008B15|nr:huntingtin-interacting protein K [Benincasa hispida]
MTSWELEARVLLILAPRRRRFVSILNRDAPNSIDSHYKSPKFLLRCSFTEMEAGDDGVERLVDSKDMQQQSKAFDKLTDRVEDRQLDSTRVQEAMASIAASAEADWNAMMLREKELAAVKINAADVDIIANELELDKKVAERTLREHKGDAVAAIRYLLR